MNIQKNLVGSGDIFIHVVGAPCEGTNFAGRFYTPGYFDET